MSRVRRTAAVLTTLACLAGAGWTVDAWPWLTREPLGPPAAGLPQAVDGGREPHFGSFVGHTEASIVGRFGPASKQWAGHYGAPPLSLAREYPDAITATYIRPSGILYLSYCYERGRLVCFSSAWMPDGAVF